MAAPAQSHLMAAERTLKQLLKREGIDDPPGCDLHGVMRGYKPRVSADLSCFVPNRGEHK